jgi:hypothetical protein
MRKNLFISLILLLFSVSIFAQVDSYGNKVFPTKLIAPQVFKQAQDPVDLLLPPVAMGAFDYYNVSNGTWGFCETDCQVSINNPNIVVGTDNRITGYSGPTYVYYSSNAGATWSATTSGLSGSQGDPVFTADSSGALYLCILNSGVYTYKSVNGGASWTGPTLIVSNGNADKEWICADPTNGTYKNNVYMAYVNFSTGGVVDFHRSTNNGASWSLVQSNLGTGSPNPGPNIAVGPGGIVYVAWYNGGGTTLKVSNNGGASLGANITASSHQVPGASNGVRICLKGDIRCNGNPNLAVDHSNGPRRGWVYNVYATNPPGPDAADIYCTRSTDQGATWNALSPVKINDDATQTDQWMCDGSVDNQGRLWAFWWDSRADVANNLLCEVYAAVSTNGGVSFSPNFKIGAQFNPAAIKIYQAANHYYLGDYQGMSGLNVTFPFYIGPTSSRDDFTNLLPDYGVGFNKTIDSINAGSTSTVRVRIPLLGPYSGTINYTATIAPSPAPGTMNFTWSPSNVKVMTGVPDSIILYTTASANVPLNLYTVTVTGTESSGPRTHTRTYQIRVGNFVGIAQNNNEIPKEYKLEQNYPNPFNPSTKINFSLPQSSNVVLKIYDALGNEVSGLINETMQAGNYTYTFDATKFATGIYFYKLDAGSFTNVKRMMLIK